MKVKEITIFRKHYGLMTLSRKEWNNLLDDLSSNDEIQILEVNY